MICVCLSYPHKRFPPPAASQPRSLAQPPDQGGQERRGQAGLGPCLSSEAVSGPTEAPASGSAPSHPTIWQGAFNNVEPGMWSVHAAQTKDSVTKCLHHKTFGNQTSDR